MVTILIVEDDETVRLLTKAHLAPGYNVLEASNGEEAYAFSKKHKNSGKYNDIVI